MTARPSYRTAAAATIVMALNSLAITTVAAGREAVFSVPLAEFSQLTTAEKRAVVGEAFKHRLQHGNNLHYELRITLRNHEYVDGKVGKVVWEGLKFGYRHWRLGDSYRMDTDLYGPPATVEPTRRVVSGFDAKQGRSQGTIRVKGFDKVFARKDVVHSPVINHNRYAYWLDGKPNREAEHLFRYLVEHQDAFSFKTGAESGSVILTVPWQPYGFSEKVGTWVLDLDSSKGFLPVHGVGYWEQARSGGKKGFRREEFTVTESALVADVWMPIKLREIIQASTLGPKLANIWDTEILKIEHGTVTADDLVVPIEKGAVVVDTFRAGVYKADDKGEPATPIRPFAR